ncbi:MAG: host attachment protein [Verrucomicrobiae bacterium]|nr:host attachment protein [Verrucomicrobiae bacterium]MDW8308406.1 host attachment protein [Verrucomicrobiales bacterium]
MKPKLIIVTDLGLLKAFRLETTPRGTPHLEPIEEHVLEDAHHRLSEKVTDFAGRHVSPSGKNWGAPMSDDHNLKLETRRRLIRALAGHIQRLVERNGENGCCLAAPKEIHRMLLDELPRPVQARIQRSVPQDLTKATKKELIEVFAAPTG